MASGNLLSGVLQICGVDIKSDPVYIDLSGRKFASGTTAGMEVKENKYREVSRQNGQERTDNV